MKKAYYTTFKFLAQRMYSRNQTSAEWSLLTFSQQVMENLSMSPALIQDLRASWLTLAWSVQVLPQYLQNQLLSAMFFVSQMYNLGCPPPQHQQLYQDRSCLNAAETSTHKDVVQVRPQHKPPFRVRRPTKTPAFDNGCNVKGCVRR